MAWQESRRGKICVLAVSLALASVRAGAGEERRSGTVLAVDHAAATLIISVGPWRLAEEVPGNVPLKIALTPSTEIVVVNRAASAAANERPGDLVEKQADAEALRPGV